MSKGRVIVIHGLKIMALPRRGGGSDHAKIFCGFGFGGLNNARIGKLGG